MAGTKLVDRAKLESTLKGFRTVFNDALLSAPALWQLLAMPVPSDNPEEEYKWMGTVPTMKPWRGDRPLARLRADGYTIKNEPFANGLTVHKDDIRFDRLGIVGPRIRDLAMMAAKHKDQLIFDFLKAGFAGTKALAYDGQFFFDTDHKDGDGPTQSNKLTAVLGSDGVALQSAIKAMREFKDENSEPLEIEPTHLVVPPALEFTAKRLMNDTLTTNGGSNILKGLLDVVVAPRLATDATKWFVLALGQSAKPFVLQTVQDVVFGAMDSMDDEAVFMRNEFRYGADWHGGAGYGLWQFAVGSDGTV